MCRPWCYTPKNRESPGISYSLRYPLRKQRGEDKESNKKRSKIKVLEEEEEEKKGYKGKSSIYL